MTDPRQIDTLLAQASRFEGLSKGFKGRRIDTGDVIFGVVILVGIIAVVWVLSYLFSLRERHGAYASPTRLFLSLCSAHRLRWPDRWLLWRLARAKKVEDPARLFLEPELLDAAAMRPWFRVRAERLREMRNSLFAEPDVSRNETPTTA